MGFETGSQILNKARVDLDTIEMLEVTPNTKLTPDELEAIILLRLNGLGEAINTLETITPTTAQNAARILAEEQRVAANLAVSTEVTAPTTAEFNALLVNLKAKGLMTADAG